MAVGAALVQLVTGFVAGLLGLSLGNALREWRDPNFGDFLAQVPASQFQYPEVYYILFINP